MNHNIEKFQTNCFNCPYFHINPPIIEEPYYCDKGAKKMPSFWLRETTVAKDCPFAGEKR